MSEKPFPEPIEVSLATAKEWEKKYDDDSTIEDSKKKVKSFLIPRESLEKVLELNTDVVRACLGINDQNQKTLLFVGTVLDPKTGYYVDVYGPPSTDENVAEPRDIVYDGVRPSPPY